MAGAGHDFHPRFAVDPSWRTCAHSWVAGRRPVRPTGSGSGRRSARAAFPGRCCRAARRRGRRPRRRVSSRSAIRPNWRPRAAPSARSSFRRRRTSGRARRPCAGPRGRRPDPCRRTGRTDAIRASRRTCAGKDRGHFGGERAAHRGAHEVGAGEAGLVDELAHRQHPVEMRVEFGVAGRPGIARQRRHDHRAASRPAGRGRASSAAARPARRGSRASGPGPWSRRGRDGR